MDAQDAELVELYLQFLRSRESAPSAWDRLSELIDEHPDRAFTVLRELIERADEGQLDLLGAGPLEEFIGVIADLCNSGDESLLHELVVLVRQSPRARKTLQMVWPGVGEEHVWAKLDPFMGSSVNDRHPGRSTGPAGAAD